MSESRLYMLLYKVAVLIDNMCGHLSMSINIDRQLCGKWLYYILLCVQKQFLNDKRDSILPKLVFVGQCSHSSWVPVPQPPRPPELRAGIYPIRDWSV